MKWFISVFLTLLACAACAPSGLHNGDLVFVGIPSDYRINGSMSDAIGDATSAGDQMNIIHAAILEIQGDSAWIIDATLKHGVDRHPLDTFLADFTLKDGSYPEFIVMRLKDDREVGTYVENAKKYVGLKYNYAFIPCDTARYCTELIRDSYVKSDGRHIFTEQPMNFLSPDGTMPEYWNELFAILGMPVPQGLPGTNPRGMMEEKCLKRVRADLMPAN